MANFGRRNLGPWRGNSRDLSPQDPFSGDLSRSKKNPDRGSGFLQGFAAGRNRRATVSAAGRRGGAAARVGMSGRRGVGVSRRTYPKANTTNGVSTVPSPASAATGCRPMECRPTASSRRGAYRLPEVDELVALAGRGVERAQGRVLRSDAADAHHNLLAVEVVGQ